MNPYVTKISTAKYPFWQNKRPLLSRLDMELTERCNNNCIHCYINLPAADIRAKGQELTTEQIKEILKEAVTLGCLTVCFTGGEPLLREDFEELYFFSRRLGLKVLIFTNATLITPQLADLFSQIPPLKSIEVSFYGMNRNSYETITRVPGSFEAALRGVNLLLEKKIRFVVKGALLPPNRKEVDEFEKWVSNIPWVDKPPSYSMFFNLRCRRDSEEKNSLIRRLRVSPEEVFEILVRRGEGFLNEMKEFCSKFIGTNEANLFSCGTGIGGGCIDAYGYLQPCMMLRHPMTIYNLKNGSIEDAVTNFFPKVRKMRTKDSDFLTRCTHCFLRGLCEQCPAMSWMEHGTLDTPVEYFCRIAHEQARYLGLLKKSEKGWEINNWKERIIDFSGRYIR